jgi:hypothetical protein
MAIQDLMTWESRKDCWRKIYQGKLYTVSCYRLGVPPTKEASYKAANAWWLVKKAEIDGTQSASYLIKELEKRWDWCRLRGETGQAADYDAAISEGVRSQKAVTEIEASRKLSEPTDAEQHR